VVVGSQYESNFRFRGLPKFVESRANVAEAPVLLVEVLHHRGPDQQPPVVLEFAPNCEPLGEGVVRFGNDQSPVAGRRPQPAFVAVEPADSLGPHPRGVAGDFQNDFPRIVREPENLADVPEFQHADRGLHGPQSGFEFDGAQHAETPEGSRVVVG